LEGEKITRLEAYCRLLWAWNEKINLTRHTDYEKFVTRDIVDSQTLAHLLQPEELVLDVGTGGGVPGIILAILRPDLRVVLCDSVGKKARAVADMVERLQLKVPVVAGRVQDLLGSAQFNTLVARGVGRLRETLGWLKPHWAAFDRLLVIKGRTWLAERGEARHYGLMRSLALRCLAEYTTPSTGAENVILQICPEDRLIPPKGCRLRDLRKYKLQLVTVVGAEESRIAGKVRDARNGAKGPVGREEGSTEEDSTPPPTIATNT